MKTWAQIGILVAGLAGTARAEELPPGAYVVKELSGAVSFWPRFSTEWVAIRKGDERAGWLAWLASFVLAGPLLVARFNLLPEGLEHYTVSRFHLLPMVLLAVPVAVAIDRLPGTLLANDRAGSLLGIAVFLGAAVATFPGVARYHTACVQRSLENMLATLPKGAVVIGTFGSWGFAAQNAPPGPYRPAIAAANPA